MADTKKAKKLTVLGIIRMFLPQIIPIVIAAILIAIYDYLPQRKLLLTNLDQANEAFDAIGAYSDKVDGGASEVIWKKKDPYKMSCVLVNKNPYPFCGIIFNFNFGPFIDTNYSVDLNQYDRIKVHIKTSDSLDFVRMNIRSAVDPYYKPGDDNSTFFMSTFLTKNDFNRTIEVELDKFTVASWWLNLFNVKEEHSKPNLKNVKTFAFDITLENAKDITHSIEVIELEFVGVAISRASWYLLVLGIWIVFVVSLALRERIQYLKEFKNDKALVKYLEKRHEKLKEKNLAYQKDSQIDPLTQIFNRRGFENRVDSINNADNENNDAGLTSAIIFMDIDFFKMINDNHGHEVGDQILKGFVHIVSNQIRENDCFARWGGEEFVLLCPSSTPLQGYSIAEKIREKVADHNFMESPSINITASFGVSCFEHSNGFDRALQEADEALYRAKESGRDKVVLSEWAKF